MHKTRESLDKQQKALHIGGVSKAKRTVCEHDWDYNAKKYVKICRKCGATYLV